MKKIEISYSGARKGQVESSPLRININEVCRFTCADPGTLMIEFLETSPLAQGKTIGKDNDFKAARPGKFKYRCILTTPDGKPKVLGDGDDPGGELEFGLE